MKRILVLAGGGCKGPIQSQALKRLEIALGIPLWRFFDLIVGTSIGSINGAMAASGIDSTTSHLIMLDTLPKVFKWKPFYWQGKYDPKPAELAFNNFLPNRKLKDCKTKFMCTSHSVVDGMPHFFKSWEDKDGDLPIYEAVHRSFAAPVYFGPVVDKDNKQVWIDGGSGSENSPILFSFVEAMRQGWENEEVVIVSIGTGLDNIGMSFDKAEKLSNAVGGQFRQFFYYSDPLDGGLARKQALPVKLSLMNNLAQSMTTPKIIFNHFDVTIPEKINIMDGVKYIPDYEKYGNIVGDQLVQWLNEFSKDHHWK